MEGRGNGRTMGLREVQKGATYGDRAPREEV